MLYALCLLKYTDYSPVFEGQSFNFGSRFRLIISQVHSSLAFSVRHYIETKTSMAFVDHLDQTQEERKQFQLAPSYSVLFKWGNRKKVAFNQFWKPGIGLNIASPDLQLDEAPDIALSLTGSIINDWIQAGGGYNVTGEAPYWFFALRLPIISLAPNSLDTGQMPMPDN